MIFQKKVRERKSGEEKQELEKDKAKLEELIDQMGPEQLRDFFISHHRRQEDVENLVLEMKEKGLEAQINHVKLLQK